MVVKQKLINKKERWTKGMVEYLLDSLKIYKVMCDFSGKNFDAVKIWRKKYEGFGPIKTPANPRADLSIPVRKEFEGKIKLENKPTDRLQ